MTSSAPTPALGLRDRKRIETRARLEEAAATLALRDGIEAATVEAISERAGVSARTFFNYFDSKEDALLGVRDLTVDEDTLAALAVRHDERDPADAVVALLFAVLGPDVTDPAAHRTRSEVLRRFPHLLGRRLDHMTRATAQLTSAVQAVLDGPRTQRLETQRLETQRPGTQRPGTQRPGTQRPGTQRPETQPAVAETVLNLCVGALRVAVREWYAQDTPGDRHQLELRTAALVRLTIGRLQ